jgi:hypothetical protein
MVSLLAGYSSNVINLFGLKPGIGAVQAGRVLHRGGFVSSISNACSFSLEFRGNILRACCFMRILQVRSWLSSLCCLNLPIVYCLRISSRRADSSSSAGGGLVLSASKAAKITSKSRALPPFSPSDFLFFFALTFRTAFFGSSLKFLTTLARNRGRREMANEVRPAAVDNIMVVC